MEEKSERATVFDTTIFLGRHNLEVAIINWPAVFTHYYIWGRQQILEVDW